MQQKEAAEKLENMHRYYKGMMKKPPDSERPSAPDGWSATVRYDVKLPSRWPPSEQPNRRKMEEEKPSSVTLFKRRKEKDEEGEEINLGLQRI
jgi:hypothetical protein